MAKQSDTGKQAKDLPAQADSSFALPSRGAARRRFALSGVAASGILLTIASRPVLGDPIAKSPSGFVSGNQSAQGPQPVSLGVSPGYWKNHTDSWPIPTDTPFKKIFPCSATSPYKKYIFLEIMSPQDDDRNNLGMHLAAALLNARKGWTPFLPEDTILKMFSDWQSTGRYSPVPGVYWDAAQIVVYIKATQA